MTPEEILADLRDIHLPEMAAGGATADLVLWPVLLVLAAALLVACLIWRRRTIWRRDFFHDLSQIEHTVEERGEHEGWAKLAQLLKRLAIQRHGRLEVAALSGEPWLRQLDDLVGSDLFTNGPGRGLIAFPYLGDSFDDDMSRHMRADLDATIEILRNQRTRLGMAR